MSQDNFSTNCRNCNEEMQIKVMACPRCSLRLEGDITLPRLARLAPEDRNFIELFVLSGGSLKEVGKIMDISYPTVRGRLDKVIKALKHLDKEVEKKRLEVLAKLKSNEISTEDALKTLNNL
ncbi:DUF2089 family protein [Lentisphaerota bacterium ZTH]|nr:DUF2089 domain-containing protein [Lentisphaerota bacterium]WET06877.1 DUF2089 family protein [Lentisphaerota bacterium ZTH]